MNRNIKNINEVLDGSMPSASKEQIDSACGRVYNRLHTDGALNNVAEPEVAEPIRTFASRRWVAALSAVAVLVVAGVWMGIAWQSHRVYGVLQTPEGSLVRVSEGGTVAVGTGERIGTHQTVRSNDNAGATFALADGSRVEMRSHSELVLERADDGVRIRLNTGGVIVNAAKQRNGHLYVQTKDVTVAVVGTVFFVNAEAKGSRVGVVEGEVYVQQGQTTQKLFPGQQIITEPSMPSILVGEEIAWSHSALAHMALLQRFTMIEPPLLQFEAASIRRDPQPAFGTILGPIVCRGVDDGEAHILPDPDAPFPMTAPLGRCVGRYANLLAFVAAAYGVSPRNVSGGPDWASAVETFQIEAKSENPATTNRDQLRQMLQALLADRFKLKVRRETKKSQGYALVVETNGLKPKEAVGGEEPLTSKVSGGGGGVRNEGQMVVIEGKTSTRAFAAFLATCSLVGLPVVDKTELPGEYDFNLTLNWILLPDRTAPLAGPPGAGGAGPTCRRSYDPTIAKALKDQLGLRLESQTVPEDFIVIEHAEKPSEN